MFLNSLFGFGKSSGENSGILKIGLVSRLKPDFEELGLLPIELIRYPIPNKRDLLKKELSIVYIDEVLIFSKDIDSQFKHLNVFHKIIKHNGLVVSAKKIKLFRTKIRFLGHDLYQGTYKPICRFIEFFLQYRLFNISKLLS